MRCVSLGHQLEARGRWQRREVEVLTYLLTYLDLLTYLLEARGRWQRREVEVLTYLLTYLDLLTYLLEARGRWQRREEGLEGHEPRDL